MSDIKVTNSINIRKGGIKNRGVATNNLAISQTGDGYAGNTVEADSVWQAIDVSDLTTPGRFQIVNQGSTYNLLVGVSDGAGGYREISELLPGEPCSGRWSQALYVSTNGSGETTLAEYFVAEA